MFLVTAILFLLILLIPAEERVTAYLPSVRANISAEEFERLVKITIERYGLDQPPVVQYTRWVRELLRGDWGYSPSWRQPVLEGLLQRAPATIELLLFAMIPSFSLAIVMGRLSAHRQGRLAGAALRASTFVGWSFPPFILALILMNIFYAWLDWFPPERMSYWAGEVVRSDGFYSFTGLLTVDALLNLNPLLFWDALRHLVLPGFTLAFAIWALLTRIMGSSLLDVMSQEYITTARSKGLDERDVVNRHAVRNAVLPLISTGATLSASMLTTVAVVEMVFNYNGIGRWAVRSFLVMEIPVTVGFALFGCTLTMLSSLIADLLYAWVDPRVRTYSAGGGEAE
jgi:peptide/nickel transport system permease protein